jgi:hypothetical protein
MIELDYTLNDARWNVHVHVLFDVQISWRLAIHGSKDLAWALTREWALSIHVATKYWVLTQEWAFTGY